MTTNIVNPNVNEVSFKEIRKEFPKLYLAGIPAMVVSQSGTGKTQILKQDANTILSQLLPKSVEEAADYTPEKYSPEDAFFTLDATTVPGDLLGMPYLDDDESRRERELLFEGFKKTFEKQITLEDFQTYIKENGLEDIDQKIVWELYKAQATGSPSVDEFLEYEEEYHAQKQDANKARASRVKRDVIQELRDVAHWTRTHDKGKAILLIDEFLVFNQEGQKILMNAIQEGILASGERMDLEKVWVVIATNPSPEMDNGFGNYETTDPSTAVVTRMAIYFAKENHNDFMAYGELPFGQNDSEDVLGSLNKISADRKKLFTPADTNGAVFNIERSTNVHPKLLAASRKDPNLYFNVVEGDRRYYNNRTGRNLSEYMYACDMYGLQYSRVTIQGILGFNVGTTIAKTIDNLNKLVGLEELWGKGNTIAKSKMAKFSELKEFEKMFLLRSALAANTPIDFSKKVNIKKFAELYKATQREQRLTLGHLVHKGPQSDYFTDPKLFKTDADIFGELINDQIISSEVNKATKEGLA